MGDEVNGVAARVVCALVREMFFVNISAVSAPFGLKLADLKRGRAVGQEGDAAALR